MLQSSYVLRDSITPEYKKMCMKSALRDYTKSIQKGDTDEILFVREQFRSLRD